MNCLSITLFGFAVISAVLAGGHYEGGHHEGPAPYKFEYGVHDPHTGDKKSQYEHADGHGHVTGEYTLKEADGTIRVVKYKAGPHTGFNAVVERIGHAQHPAHYGHGGHHGGDHGAYYGGGGGGHGGYGGNSYVGTTHFGYGGQGGHGGYGHY